MFDSLKTGVDQIISRRSVLRVNLSRSPCTCSQDAGKGVAYLSQWLIVRWPGESWRRVRNFCRPSCAQSPSWPTAYASGRTSVSSTCSFRSKRSQSTRANLRILVLPSWSLAEILQSKHSLRGARFVERLHQSAGVCPPRTR